MDEAMKMLAQLAGKVGSTAEDMWPHAVRYVWACAVRDAILGPIFFLGGLTAIYFAYYCGKRLEKDDEPPWVVGLVGFGFGAVICIPTGIVMLGQAIPALIEPTGATIKVLLGACH